jgi:putative tryptophan/tyrosine transport system substrate-binding protein
MKNRWPLVVLPFALAAACPAGAAEVLLLKSTDAPSWKPAIEALRKKATGQNIVEADLRGDRAEADRILGTVKGRKDILVIAMGPLAAEAAHGSGIGVPVVYCMVQDIARFVQDGSGDAGISFQTPVRNQFAVFRMVHPRGVRIGVIYRQETSGALMQEALKASSVARFVLVSTPVASPQEVPPALRTMLTGAEPVDALWLPPDPLLLEDATRRFILSETLKAGRPVYTFSQALVAEGALVSAGPDIAAIGDRLAELVARWVGSEKLRGEILVPPPELVVNKKIGDKLRIDIPAAALKQANKVL